MTPISRAPTLYIDPNKSGKKRYQTENLGRVTQSPYDLVQKSESYAILIIFMDFPVLLNIVTDSQYAKSFFHIKTA